MRNQYHPLAKFLHWSIVLLVGAQFLNADWMPEVGHKVVSGFFFDVHASLGILLGIFVVILFFMHFLSRVEKPEMRYPGTQEMLAILGHYALYMLLVMTAISGWASANAEGLVVNFFRVFDMPSLATSGVIGLVGKGHELLTALLGFVVVVHILAALYHHFFLEDNVISRMRPSRISK